MRRLAATHPTGGMGLLEGRQGHRFVLPVLCAAHISRGGCFVVGGENRCVALRRHILRAGWVCWRGARGIGSSYPFCALHTYHGRGAL